MVASQTRAALCGGAGRAMRWCVPWRAQPGTATAPAPPHPAHQPRATGTLPACPPSSSPPDTHNHSSPFCSLRADTHITQPSSQCGVAFSVSSFSDVYDYGTEFTIPETSQWIQILIFLCNNINEILYFSTSIYIPLQIFPVVSIS